MPSFIMKCPWCGSAVTKSVVVQSNGNGSGNSGQCGKCHKPIRWWVENKRARIAKN